MAGQIVADMHLDRDTKNKYVYVESWDSKSAGALGALYLSKHAAQMLGDGESPPQQIRVVIKGGGS